MDEKISKLFLPLLDKLYNVEPAGEPFRKPVDVVKYGCYDYYYYVKHPIDLSTIRERLTSNQYKDAWRFVADIQLMFSNAYLFNKKGTPVYEFTNKLCKIWNSELTPIMQRLNYCCGTLHKFSPQLLFCHGTTPDRYCQIAIGARYKCYQDQYSFCIPCYNKIDSGYISIQTLSCETTRMKLPTQPVKKSDFIDCTNDHWQYENFIQCVRCERRVHQICELYPAEEDEIKKCIQHSQIETEQKLLCRVPEEFRTPEPIDAQETTSSEENNSEQSTSSSGDSNSKSSSDDEESKKQNDQNHNLHHETTTSDTSSYTSSPDEITAKTSKTSETRLQTIDVGSEFQGLDDELLQFARDVDDSHSTASPPPSPQPEENKSREENTKETSSPKKLNGHSSRSCYSSFGTPTSSNSKNSVDNIAARLSINKLSAENQSDSIMRQHTSAHLKRDKFVCNHCYRKQKTGFDLRHRRFSARRLPHTRMSRYIETKVNELIREKSPSAGEITIRVLTAYRDNVEVKPDMRDYVKHLRENGNSTNHPNLQNYPDEFAYTTRAIFAWQEIDGVDVCVFGMHVQEYGEDCPEPNRQVVYLSYIDSVHFFRPKQVRTEAYHEILLSYFKYVKKLGFRRVFIWVCPSRKGDDYIFYRHPTEQKMPTIKRLADWYVNLLDKGIYSGIVERHQNIYQYAISENWTSLLSMPYLSGDYWPTEFERLLKIMIEFQREYESKRKKQLEEKLEYQTLDTPDLPITEASNASINNSCNVTSLSTLYQNYNNPPSQVDTRMYDVISKLGLKPANPVSSVTNSNDLEFKCMSDDIRLYASGSESSRSYDQPLDLSKSSSNTSPESYYDDDLMSEYSYNEGNNRKKRRKSSNNGYVKKRYRTSSQGSRVKNGGASTRTCDRQFNQSNKTCRQKSSSQAHKDSQYEATLNPSEELMKNLERSLKRQKEGFIVVRLSECECSPHFEAQRRKEEPVYTCDLMKGREPFLQLARLNNYEFSTLRRAKFSSLAMVKHLGEYFRLEPICNECFSFDSSKRHYSCPQCHDFYLCTSCHENTPHEHIMSLMAPSTLPDIDEFLQQCSLASTTNSISSASSTISNKSFNETTLELTSQPIDKEPKKEPIITNSPLHRHLVNNLGSSTMPLKCQRQRNRGFSASDSRAEDEENANIDLFGSPNKAILSSNRTPPPSHSSNDMHSLHIELDQVLIENFVRQAEVSYAVDFDQMKAESKKLLTHYWGCPNKESCHLCKFVVLSCSFMSVLLRSPRFQMVVGCDSASGPTLPSSNTSTNISSGINLTKSHR